MEVKQLIFTGSCFFCQAKANDVWCERCEEDFIHKGRRCPVCARNNAQNLICGRCLNQPPCFVSTEVLFNYEYPTNQLIKALKFNNRPELAKCFARQLAKKLVHKDLLLPDAIIPVPLHKKRQRQRGYNQSLEIARHLGKKLNLKLNNTVCSRTINTDPQSTLPMKTRRKNVKGAFSLNEDQIPRHIAIVDDVITTGSTINELSRTFRKAGCKRIDIWAIART